jgi:peroxiredoxin
MDTAVEQQTEAAEAKWREMWREGPQRLRWDHIPLQYGDAAPDLELRSTSGDPVRLSETWAHGPALLLFWRHFGCRCGMARGRALVAEYGSYIEAGATVVVIGQGEPERAAAYASKFKLPCPVLSDPARAAYAAFGLVEGTPSQILFDAPDAFLRCDYDAGVGLQDARRALGDPMVDSPWQLPGEFVIDGHGIVRLAYRYQHCEDYPNPSVLVAAIREAAGDGWQPGREG